MDDKIIKTIKNLSESHPLRTFVEDEQFFYKKYFNNFTSSVIREKKILVFENPNRMYVVFEFDVQNLQTSEKPLFIFMPYTRKNWLKITWKGRRLSVCNAEEVKNAVWQVIKNDLFKIMQQLGEEYEKEEIWEKKLWGKRKRIPCFVSGTLLEGSSQLVVEFYDSFKDYKHKGCLFEERCYNYEYTLDAGTSHWIYAKAPEKFQITLKTSDKRAELIKGNDPEIKAYRIFHSSQTKPVRFNIEICVPETLKWWYWMIVVLSACYIVGFSLFGCVLIKKGVPLSPAFAQVGIALVTAIIATRGWIMNDETVLRRVSKIMTVLAIIILIILFVSYLASGFVLQSQ